MAEQTRLQRLEVARDLLEATLPDAAQQYAAPLIREYRAVLAEIDALTPAEPKGDAIDQLAARRTARGAGTAKSRRQASGNQG